MENVRLKEFPFEFNGKTYKLRCNFNVLADIEEEFGYIPNLNGKGMLKKIAVILTAMMNEYASSQGWEEHFTSKEVGRVIMPEDIPVQQIAELFIDALYKKGKKEEDSKN